jgi:predicted nuclease of predicted toxin-antitoxin system
MYQYYPKILYSVNEFDKIKAVDITKSAKVKNLILSSSDSNYLRRYVVQNGERPDIVSFKLYDSPKYEYLLLLVNNIVSIYDDWP